MAQIASIGTTRREAVCASARIKRLTLGMANENSLSPSP